MACPKNLNPARAAGYLKEMVFAHLQGEGEIRGTGFMAPSLFNNSHASDIHDVKMKEGLMAKGDDHGMI